MANMLAGSVHGSALRPRRDGLWAFSAVYDHLMTLSLTQYILHRYSLGRGIPPALRSHRRFSWYGWRLQQAWRACIGVEERCEG